jgi:XisH protein
MKLHKIRKVHSTNTFPLVDGKYSQVLERQNFSRSLYLAISESVFLDFFSEELPQLMIELNNLKLLVFDADLARIVKWII